MKLSKYGMKRKLIILVVTVMVLLVIKGFVYTVPEMPIEESVYCTVISKINGLIEPVPISKEEALKIMQFLTEGNWDNTGTSDCFNNCILTLNGKRVYYHSDCGTFNDAINEKSLTLDSNQQLIVNTILEKYISLSSIETSG